MKLERIILIFILVLFVLTAGFAFLSARTESKNRIVLKDISRIAEVLKIYHDENGFYPHGNGTPNDIESYLASWPKPKLNCEGVSQYNYSQKLSGEDYQVTFCLDSKIGSLTSGIHTLSTRGIN